jgi:hypothetical protein
VHNPSGLLRISYIADDFDALSAVQGFRAAYRAALPRSNQY